MPVNHRKIRYPQQPRVDITKSNFYYRGGNNIQRPHLTNVNVHQRYRNGLKTKPYLIKFKLPDGRVIRGGV
jgi:hypothetical protein